MLQMFLKNVENVTKYYYNYFARHFILVVKVIFTNHWVGIWIIMRIEVAKHMFLLTCLYLLAILGCFLLMPHTISKCCLLRKIKFLFLWSILFLIFASLLKRSYVCQLLTLVGIFSGFIILLNVPYASLSLVKKSFFCLDYIVLILVLIQLIYHLVYVLVF